MCILGSLNPLKGASAGRWVSPPERKSQPHRGQDGQKPGKNRSQWGHRKQRPQLLLSAPCRHQPAESSRRFKKRDGRRLRRSRKKLRREKEGWAQWKRRMFPLKDIKSDH